MAHDETTLWKLLSGGVVTVGVFLFGWVHTRINRVEDKKVSKEVFDQFQKTNDQAHKFTHDTLATLGDKQDKLFNLIGQKQDKK